MSTSSRPAAHDYSQPGLWQEKPEAWHDFVKGVQRRILANSLTGTMALYRLEPSSVVALHSHPHAQYGVCLEGSGEFKIGDKVWNVKKGDGYYIPPGIKHELIVGGRETAVLVEFFTPHREDFLKEALPSDGK
jgi:quercetin dioxygenase-like cupin family protein